MSIAQDNKIRELEERVAELERLVAELTEKRKPLSLKKDAAGG